MGVVQSKKKSNRDLKAYGSRYLTSSTTSSNGSQTKKSDSRFSKHHDSRTVTPIAVNSNPLLSKISSMTSRSPPSIPSSPPSSVDKYSGVHQSNSYFLPKDWENRDYENNLHFALRSVFGGNVSQAVLPRLQKGANVIQLGLCTGEWLTEMAIQFPFCHFTGVEVVPGSLLKDFAPLPNVQYERGKPALDLLDDMPDSSVDYVHLRACSSFFTRDQFRTLFVSIHRILKSGGVVRMEDISNEASGTVMIESFVETLRTIADANDIEFDMAIKVGDIANQCNLQTIESKRKRVQYGSGGKVEEEFIMFILGIFETLTEFMAPQLGLDPEDYKHRVEMFCAQCVKNDAHMDWYSWVFQKP